MRHLPAKARGERNGNSRLTEDQVREILAAPKSWGMCTQFAARFNVTAAAISDIFRGENMGAHQMTSVTFCAYCGAGMLHVEAETCSSYCRDKLALRRASMVSSAELLARAERAVPEAKYCRDLGFDEYQPSGPVFFGTDVPLPREIPTYELDQTDRAPAVIVWAMGGFFVAIGIILIWAFS